MKKQKVSTAIRRKIQCDNQTTVYSVSKSEMLDLIGKKMVSRLSEEEKDRLSNPFPFFKVCKISKENEFEFQSWKNANSLFAHNIVLLFIGLDVYEYSIPWLCAGGFKKDLKKILR